MSVRAGALCSKCEQLRKHCGCSRSGRYAKKKAKWPFWLRKAWHDVVLAERHPSGRRLSRKSTRAPQRSEAERYALWLWDRRPESR